MLCTARLILAVLSLSKKPLIRNLIRGFLDRLIEASYLTGFFLYVIKFSMIIICAERKLN
mgnify:CR=1 FL=1